MTLESSLPYASLVTALIAGYASGRPAAGSLEHAAKAIALASLAMFAYFRGVAPASIAQALTVGAIAQALLPRGPERFRNWGIVALAAGWLIFAYLFFRSGAGFAALRYDVPRALLLIPLLLAAGIGVVRIWRGERPLRLGAGADLIALLVLGYAAVTLRWSLWPAIAGSVAVIAGEGLLIAAGAGALGPWRRRLAWGLSFLGQASIAYAFLR